ncbi:MAG: hypothetical protein Q9203_003780 [Teloschistes exilis]
MLSIVIADVLQIRDLRNPGALSEVLQELHDKRWSMNSKPLWKLAVLREPVRSPEAGSFKIHIAFVYHHILGDGLSGTAFQKSLLGEIKNTEKAGLQTIDVPKVIDTPIYTDLVEPVEKLTSLLIGWLFLLQQLVKEYAPSWLTSASSSTWTGQPVQTLEMCPFRSRVRIAVIWEAEGNLLLKESRRHAISLTSLLTATAVAALAQAVPQAANITGITPYSFRRMTGTPEVDMTVQISSFQTSYSADVLDRMRKASLASDRAESLWKGAKYFHTQMRNELDKCAQDNVLGLLPYISNHVAYYEKKFGKPRETTFELSNLGVMKIGGDVFPDAWSLDSMTFTQGAQPAGPAISVNCISVDGGALTIAITWQDSIIHESIINALATEYRTLARSLQLESLSRNC